MKRSMDDAAVRSADRVDVSAAVFALARRIVELPEQEAAVRARAERLGERMAAGRYHVAVLGDFKRGKSSLINALIGRPVLPTGVVPLTAVATEVRFGSDENHVVVVFDDGRTVQVPHDSIGDYATQRGNPDNQRRVRRVEVAVTTCLGAPGLVLVDTPGVASVNEHQTAVAHQVLHDSDGAVVVLSADSPLSESERELLSALTSRGGQLFVVVNKCDHLSTPELEEVRTYVTGQLERVLGRPVIPSFVSARAALDASATPPHGWTIDRGFLAFREALEVFVRADLGTARQQAGVAELERMAARLSAAVEVERAAFCLDVDTLDLQLRRFETAAREVWRLFRGDCTILEHEIAELGQAIERRLAEGAQRATGDRWVDVMAVGGPLRRRALDAALDRAVDAAVREGFEPVRQDALQFAELRWAFLVDEFTERVHARARELQAAASELFSVHLPRAPLPSLDQERERFSYHFVHAESVGSSAIRGLRALAPGERARNKMVEEAHRRLAEELEKHAGRARWDIVQRLDEARRRFVAAMKTELEETEGSILTAAHQAASAMKAGREVHAAREEIHRQVEAVVRDVQALVVGRRHDGGPEAVWSAPVEDTGSDQPLETAGPAVDLGPASGSRERDVDAVRMRHLRTAGRVPDQ